MRAADLLWNLYNELSEQFETKLLTVAANYMETEFGEPIEEVAEEKVSWGCENDNAPILTMRCPKSYTVLISFSPEELAKWEKGYRKDKYFAKILEQIGEEGTGGLTVHNRYRLENDRLLYFRDNLGNTRLCVPSDLTSEVIREEHDTITEGAHCGYHKAYNRLSSKFYWPSMSREIKRYIATCDVCQKIKPKRHGPVGLLQPIPIPTQPFEVISMDFITKLPITKGGFNSILVIVDKLTKYALFIPTVTSLNEEGCARLFFHHVVSKFGLPRQIISDRDVQWRGDFWKEICRLMGMRQSLTTAYHPQANGQTEIVNQYLEIVLRAYVGSEDRKERWDKYLDALSLSFNSPPHTSTGFALAYLLRGFLPLTSLSLMNPNEAVAQSE
jgi:transposase InsO family protein